MLFVIIYNIDCVIMHFALYSIVFLHSVELAVAAACNFYISIDNCQHCLDDYYQNSSVFDRENR